MNTINFYSSRGEHGCFSNFSRHPIVFRGEKYKTSEAAYQAQKFLDPSFQKKVRETDSPREAAKLGRNLAFPIREDWDSIKVDVMREVVRAKFTQHEDCRKTLVKTGDSKLVECTENDQFWAWSKAKGGENWLGRILMEIREELRGVDSSSACVTTGS